MIQGMLDQAEHYLKTQTPETYTKMLGAASENLRRAKELSKQTSKPAEEASLLDDFRRMMEPEEAPHG